MTVGVACIFMFVKPVKCYVKPWSPTFDTGGWVGVGAVRWEQGGGCTTAIEPHLGLRWAGGRVGSAGWPTLARLAGATWRPHWRQEHQQAPTRIPCPSVLGSSAYARPRQMLTPRLRRLSPPLVLSGPPPTCCLRPGLQPPASGRPSPTPPAGRGSGSSGQVGAAGTLPPALPPWPTRMAPFACAASPAPAGSPAPSLSVAPAVWPVPACRLSLLQYPPLSDMPLLQYPPLSHMLDACCSSSSCSLGAGPGDNHRPDLLQCETVVVRLVVVVVGGVGCTGAPAGAATPSGACAAAAAVGVRGRATAASSGCGGGQLPP